MLLHLLQSPDDSDTIRPLVRSVTFDHALHGVPWAGIQACLQFPNITSLYFTVTSQWAAPGRPEEQRWHLDTLPTPGASGIPSRIPLTTLSYTTLVWRELKELAEAARFPHTETLAEEYAAEARGLAPLVPAMQDTAESLRLPLDTSPVQEMCEGYWPRLSDLSFRGSYLQSMPLSTMSTLLSRMPRLRNLSLEIAQSPSHSRAPIFGAHAPTGCEYLPLRSLTVAYPDPDDALFTSVGADLIRLSIRDWPRYYYSFRGKLRLRWVAPILSTSECLRLLTRMNVPHIRSLEVVYKADGPDDALFHHIVTSYPDLEKFEIHRYRADNDEDDPPYEHIVRLLAPLKRLRHLRLNLDFDHQGRPLGTQTDPEFASMLEPPDRRPLDCARAIMRFLHTERPWVARVEMLHQDGPCPVWRPCYYKDGLCDVVDVLWVPSQADSEWPPTDTDWHFIRFW
ncbi:hypothetical protein C8Q77DRAFT_733105 [Trametes polyzona]|nr:hypothetical protein C8Q77DRAFT_733105 [Trametes polyzona]